MKANAKVTVVVSDGKRNVVADADAIIHDGGPGVTLVWTWGRKDMDSEERPVAFTKLPIANLQKISEGRFLLVGDPVYWENLEEIGL